MVKLTAEQRVALQEHPEGVACEDTETQRVYFLVDSEIHQRAIQALKRQQDREAIAEGLADMEAGRVVPLDQAFEEIRTRLELHDKR
ncbi:hypothetical protein N8590_02535 [bacterium]|jgi:predicted transcriptional regulator|nr:hypothetical protein [Planctomicrobium sp.]MDA7503915.1 hypothetical protein [bacterium]MDA7527842.1 hypothetical protein [bacterium]MDB4731586.1 hypothetical protein [bacterium]